MTLRHQLKVWVEYFPPFWDGSCVHSIRKIDDGRTFAVGDEVTFVEYVTNQAWTQHPAGGQFTGRWVRAEITHITDGGRIGRNVELPASLVVFSFRVSARSDGRELYRGQA